MRSPTMSSVGQFRSNVQWFLEGNTPTHQSEVLADLAFSLRALSTFIEREQLDMNSPSVQVVRTWKDLSRKDLQDIAKLKGIVGELAKLVDAKVPALIASKEFRETAVHLIIVAESYPDLQLRKAVLDLSRKL